MGSAIRAGSPLCTLPPCRLDASYVELSGHWAAGYAAGLQAHDPVDVQLNVATIDLAITVLIEDTTCVIVR